MGPPFIPVVEAAAESFAGSHRMAGTGYIFIPLFFLPFDNVQRMFQPYPPHIKRNPDYQKLRHGRCYQKSDLKQKHIDEADPFLMKADTFFPQQIYIYIYTRHSGSGGGGDGGGRLHPL